MERFVIKQNIEHYRALLDITTDLERRGVFEKLLREEEAKLKKYDDDNKKNRPAPARRLNQSRFSSSGSLAMLAAMRRASSLVSSLAADRRPGFSSVIDLRPAISRRLVELYLLVLWPSAAAPLTAN